MKRALLTATLLLPTLSLFSLGQEDASPREPQSRFSEHIVWMSNPPDRTEFIPVSRLQEAARTSLPSHPDEIDRVEQKVRRSEANSFKGEEIDCGHSSESAAAWRPSGSARSLVDLLHFVPLTGYGTVTEVVLGLGRGQVATMVYVEVEEIWGCPLPAGARTVALGDVVSISQEKGRIEIDGQPLCNATDQILGTPDIGTKVIFGGSPVASDPYYIGRGLLLPVVDGQILPQPYEALAERVAQPFDQIRAQMQPELPMCERADETD